MALCLDEDEVWKCTKHPSKRRRRGICPICLRERLLALCPECANVRPCSCCATSSSSSSSSSSFSRFSFSVSGAGAGVGAVGRVHNLIENEPSLRRSRSMAIPFLRSRSRFSGGDRDFDPDSTEESPALNRSKSTRSFWSMFKSQKSNRSGVQEDRDSKKVLVGRDAVGDASRRTTATTTMMRSRSVAVSGSGGRELRPPAKGRGWFFPSPIKAFRQSKASKVNQERSPLYRG